MSSFINNSLLVAFFALSALSIASRTQELAGFNSISASDSAACGVLTLSANTGMGYCEFLSVCASEYICIFQSQHYYLSIHAQVGVTPGRSYWTTTTVS